MHKTANTKNEDLNATQPCNSPRTLRTSAYMAILILALSYSLSTTPIQAATCPVTNLTVNYPHTVTPGQWVQIQVTVIVACSLSAIGGQYQGTIQLMPTGITRVITTQAMLGPVTSVIVTAPTVTGPWNLTVVVTIIDESYGLGSVDSITNQPISIQVQNPVSYLTTTMTTYATSTVTVATPTSISTITTLQSISLTPVAQPYLQFSTVLSAIAFAVALFMLHRTRQKKTTGDTKNETSTQKA